MSEEIYNKLRLHLDSMPAGYPETGTGAEIKMLKKFYTPEQARIALEFKRIPEKASAVAERLGMDVKDLSEKAEQMAKEGSLFRVMTPDGPVYAQPNYVMGLYEWHVHSIDKEAAEYADEIYDALFEKHWKGLETKQLRVVPVQKSVEVENMVRSYDDLREVVKGKTGGPYAVAPCICRVEQKVRGNEKAVTRPMETCLSFGLAAKYYIEMGIGRQLTLDELMSKLDECEAASLIPFSTNTQDPVNMCMCDKDTCQMLRIISKWPKPVDGVHSPYYAAIDREACTGCGKCIKRCQIDAVKEVAMPEGTKQKKYAIDLDRCFGCGLCVSACKNNALSMKLKDVLPNVPENTMAMNMLMAQERMKPKA